MIGDQHSQGEVILIWSEAPDQRDESAGGNLGKKKPVERPPTLADDIKKLREAGLNVIDGTEPGTVMIFFHGIRPGNGLSEDEQEVPAPPHRKPN